MRLLIISNLAHYERDGQVVARGPVMREFGALSRVFDEIYNIAPLYRGEAPAFAMPYPSDQIHLIPVPPAGGTRLIDKLILLSRYPSYMSTILRELFRADVVHVRCPSNLGLLAILILAFVPKPRLRWVKYGGAWIPSTNDAWTSHLQRWWLRHGFHRGTVSVNGEWPNQAPHVYAFVNPCLTVSELEEGGRIGKTKTLSSPVRLLFVGRLDEKKGITRALQIMSDLIGSGVPATFSVVGDGPNRPEYEALTRQLNIESLVIFHGWLPRPKINPLYAESHFLLLPSDTEGWPKVLSEAMAYGVVPIASAVGSIPLYLGKFSSGRCFPAKNVASYSTAIIEYVNHPDQWKIESDHSLNAARFFSYDTYLERVCTMLGIDFPAQNA